ncbi:MAG: DnaD domain protein [Dehalococcoidales bacterium]|nr:MAG: DnaD domain protein [Dehalococcoidales bacterium]
MKQFEGFPTRMQFTPIPNVFISKLLPQIEDINELKTTLHIFRAIYGKRGYPRFVTYGELISDAGLVKSLNRNDEESEKVLSDSLEMAVKRGTLLSLELDQGGKREELYFINTENDKSALDKIQKGEIKVKGMKPGKRTHAIKIEDPPDIFTLYEENVGMLNPLTAEWLKEAENLYPESWIRDAIKEAVSLNKRNWRYIDRILENWSAEGRSDGTHKRGSKTDSGKYRKQKYDHLVKR